MIDAVIAFAALLAAFEFTILCMLPINLRLRLLGSGPARLATHFAMLGLNLWVHWGTVTGTMSATAAFVVSMITVFIARLLHGQITGGRYQRGLFNHANEVNT